MHVDIHQHVWPDVLVEELRRRSQPPRLDGWTLLTSGEPPFEVNPADHQVGWRAAQAASDGVSRVVIGLSSPLGIEYLMPEDAEPLLDAYHVIFLRSSVKSVSEKALATMPSYCALAPPIIP